MSYLRRFSPKLATNNEKQKNVQRKNYPVSSGVLKLCTSYVLACLPDSSNLKSFLKKNAKKATIVSWTFVMVTAI